MPSRILVVEDEVNLCETFRRFLAKDGYLVDTAGDYQAAVGLLGEHDYDAIFTDINLTGKETGLDLLAARNGRQPAAPIIITGFPSVSSAAEAVRLGGYDYLCKPVEKDVLLLSLLERDLKRRRDFHRLLIGKSEAMQAVYGLIDSLADLRTTVLITGASGTGKELAAEALHYAGCRRDQALVKVNCSALAESVLESELFGHVRGAFTGATHDRIGRFAKADRGTLFLDEIGDLSPLLQQKLLRVLQEKEFERVGDSTPIKVDVRIIAATNRDLKALVTAGAFREDLYYRIKVVELKLPPLRERRLDIPLLADFFLKEFSAEFHKVIDGVSAEVLELFLALT